MKKTLLLCAFVVLATMSSSANADIIPNIFNTGVDSSGTPLPSGSIDSHYSTTAFPAGFGPTTYAHDPIPTSWVPNTGISRWIGPDPVGDAPMAGGIYDYTMSFDMTGFDPSTAFLTGGWASDNASSILVNGSSTGLSHSGGSSAFLAFDSFLLDSSNSTFVAGINSVTFRVNNISNATGLHVTGIRGEAQKTAVPEPLAASSLGVIALLGLVRRRRRA